MHFRLTPRSMTLSYKFEFFREFRGISQIWEATIAKGIDSDSVVSQ